MMAISRGVDDGGRKQKKMQVIINNERVPMALSFVCFKCKAATVICFVRRMLLQVLQHWLHCLLALVVPMD